MAKEDSKRNTKCLAYVAAFVVFQTIIIVVFALTVMRIKSPKLRFGDVAVENFSTANTNSVSMTLNAQVTAWHVGEAFIPSGRAKARQTKKFNVTVDITSAQISSNDINSGVLTLTSEAKLNGKVHLMKVIKKKKSAAMSCTMAVNLATRAVQNLKCK
ncbi:hypothetical protein L1049_006333 [Liquidambar formosana]|uniref:Late embryogenesis abundant protein LEA-2 subgroup domain-containing protein n=1 Tax=Liquidambar formosana TaxID=63359 RepID=A0AAP0RGU9_LIQFO